MTTGIARLQRIKAAWLALKENRQERPWGAVLAMFDKMKKEPKHYLSVLEEDVYNRRGVQELPPHTHQQLGTPTAKNPESVSADEWSPGKPPAKDAHWVELCRLREY
jgi:hypothetical protein